METEEIRICSSHQDYPTPLIWTFAFPGAEYWCPYCGMTQGMMGAGRRVISTPKLRNRLKRFKKLSKDYLHAKGVSACDETLFEGKWITPDKLPIEEHNRLKQIIEDWKYEQKPVKQK